jgi:hypothetical protein
MVRAAVAYVMMIIGSIMMFFLVKALFLKIVAIVSGLLSVIFLIVILSTVRKMEKETISKD